MNAVPQDAFLGRGTTSPYLTILHYLGFICDENAPTSVPDEFMDAMGPNAKISELEEEMSLLRSRLEQTYGRASQAAGLDKDEYTALQRKLATARQIYRKEVQVMLRREYYKFRNDRELDRQLYGDVEPEPQKPREPEPVFFSLPERRRLAEVMGDLDEDLPRDSIVSRKIRAIKAWIDYAGKVELKEPASPEPPGPPEVQRQEQQQGIPTPPVNTNLAMGIAAVQKIASSPQPLMPRTSYTPPPTYIEAIANSNTIPTRKAARKKPPPEPCPWCGKTFTRKAKFWDHTDKHLAYLHGGNVPCPFATCGARGSVFGYGHPFQSHMFHHHGIDLRPHEAVSDSERLDGVSMGTRVGTSEDTISLPRLKITLVGSHTKDARGCKSPCTPRIVIKRRHREDPELPRKRRIVIK